MQPSTFAAGHGQAVTHALSHAFQPLPPRRRKKDSGQAPRELGLVDQFRLGLTPQLAYKSGVKFPDYVMRARGCSRYSPAHQCGRWPSQRKHRRLPISSHRGAQCPVDPRLKSRMPDVKAKLTQFGKIRNFRGLRPSLSERHTKNGTP
jgi:hypothetical protein